MKKEKRKVDLVVISDVHLGTYGCRAKELNIYLKSIAPKQLILNGDIIDIWQFKKRYFPKSHMKVLKQILNLAAKGTEVIYITGNHDETLRKFQGLQLGKIRIENSLELNLDGVKTWFFHGDALDVVMTHSKWIARIGAIGYDGLILANILVNRFRVFLGKPKVSFSKRIKNNVKTAVKFINDFEELAADMAHNKGISSVVCGHIHQPEIKSLKNGIQYYNSGDWIENLSSLEYSSGGWKLYLYNEEDNLFEDSANTDLVDMDQKALFQKMLNDLQTDL